MKEHLSRKQRRELERQQRKEQQRQLREKGLHRTEAKQLVREKADKNVVRNALRRRKYKLLVDAGYSRDEARKLQNAAIETVRAKIEEKTAPKELPKKERKPKAEPDTDEYLLLFWQDLIGFSDDYSVHGHKGIFKHMTANALMRSARGLIELDFGESPASLYEAIVTRQKNKAIQMYSREGYHLIYEGKGKRIKELLVAINTMLVLLYDSQTKLTFLVDFLEKLRPFNPKLAERIYREVVE
ncbi:hypothetical protein PMI08_03165 [Brevibacillus sp. CF112]|uniref:hypothetical protein n=1 Tax=Brevibacillus sp. CF112 TaxID=1144311 RepID=UPI000271881D|nr:hypothetical protein [Brevibacillus sp. CF112]EJL42514.1 hypothetical protein PMI08_03165 [Brevibacillus sp. CF112]